MKRYINQSEVFKRVAEIAHDQAKKDHIERVKQHSGDSELIESLVAWRDEFRKQCHPVTLTLDRAISRIVETIK